MNCFSVFDFNVETIGYLLQILITSLESRTDMSSLRHNGEADNSVMSKSTIIIIIFQQLYSSEGRNYLITPVTRTQKGQYKNNLSIQWKTL